MSYSLIIDIIALLILVYAIFDGYKKGFIQSAILVVGYVLSIFAAIYLSTVLSDYIFQNFVKSSVLEIINSTIKENTTELSVIAILPLIMEKLPAVILNPILGHYGGQESIIQLIDSKTNGVLDNVGIALTENIAQPVITSMLRVIICLIIFILCTIIIRIVAGMFKPFHFIPLIGPLNSILGAALGVIKACIIFYICGLIISAIISLTANSLPYLNNQVINSTYFLKLFIKL